MTRATRNRNPAYVFPDPSSERFEEWRMSAVGENFLHPVTVDASDEEVSLSSGTSSNFEASSDEADTDEESLNPSAPQEVLGSEEDPIVIEYSPPPSSVALAAEEEVPDQMDLDAVQELEEDHGPSASPQRTEHSIEDGGPNSTQWPQETTSDLPQAFHSTGVSHDDLYPPDLHPHSLAPKGEPVFMVGGEDTREGAITTAATAASSAEPITTSVYHALRLPLDLDSLWLFAHALAAALIPCSIRIDDTAGHAKLVSGRPEDLRIGGAVWEALEGWPRESLLLENTLTSGQSGIMDFSLLKILGVLQWGDMAQREIQAARATGRAVMAWVPGAKKRVPSEGVLIPFAQAWSAIQALMPGFRHLTASQLQDWQEWSQLLVGCSMDSSTIEGRTGSLGRVELRFMRSGDSVQCRQYRALRAYAQIIHPDLYGLNAIEVAKLKEKFKPTFFGQTIILRSDTPLHPRAGKALAAYKGEQYKPPQKTKKRHAITYSAVRQAGEKRPRRKQ